MYDCLKTCHYDDRRDCMQNLVNLSITFTKLWKINMTFCIKICGVLHREVSIKARWPKMFVLFIHM